MTRFAMMARLAGAMALAGCVGLALADDKKDGEKHRARALDLAVKYLKERQGKDGSWSKGGNPGISGLILLGLFKSGKVKADDETGAKGLKVLEALIDAEEGHLAKGTKPFMRNYITCINLLALEASGEKKYEAVIAKAAAYLKTLQWDEKEQMTSKDAFYGGVGYGAKIRPDLSNTQYFLDALKAAKVPAKDAAYKKAVVFVSRCQNLKGEHNDLAWAGKIDDGSFIYVVGQGKGKGKGKGKGSAKEKVDDKRPGYGSMTYAGLRSLHHCGIDHKDTRFARGLEWIGKNYSVEENPGRREIGGGREAAETDGLFYYLYTMAKSLDTMGIDVITDAKGKKRDWRAEMVAFLVKKQRKDGSWVNESGAWMENNPDLCTGFAVAALSYCKPKP